MNDVFSIILFMITLSIILLTITVALMKCAINDLKKELEQHQMKLKQLDFYNLSDHEKRLDQLEEVLELKEYFDEEPLSK